MVGKERRRDETSRTTNGPEITALRLNVCVVVALAIALGFAVELSAASITNTLKPAITLIDPPEKDFFSKRLDFHGIPIKAHKVVVDEALYAAYDRLSMMFSNLVVKQPMVISNLVVAGAALHIIGRDQVTTDCRSGVTTKVCRVPNTRASRATSALAAWAGCSRRAAKRMC
jgi:hypothetical protein